MADDDLVSKVVVEGTEEANAKLDAYAAAGEKSFDRVNAAAEKHAAAMAAAGKASAKGTKDAAAGIDKLNETKPDPGIENALKQIQSAAAKLGTEIRKTVKDTAEFVAKVAALTGAAAAAGAGVLKLASSVAKQGEASSNALDKQLASQTAANNAVLQARQGAIGYESAQRKLFEQFSQGKISNEDYQKSLKDLKAEYKEQVRVAQQLENAQESTRLENERIKKSFDDKKAYDKLIDTWGGPMLGALTTLGQTVNSLFESFKTTFGPPIAALLGVIDVAIGKNTGSITKFFDTAAQKVSTFVSQNGPAIQTAIEGIGKVLGGIFNGIIEALPTLVALFNNVFLPTLNAVGSALTSLANGFNTIAGFINSVFGTNIPQATAGVIALVTALTFMTGGFKVLLGVIQIAIAAFALFTGPFGGIIFVVVALTAALVALAVSIDWAAFAERAVTAGQRILAWFTDFPKNLANIWEAIKAGTATAWESISKVVIGTWDAVVKFFTDFPGNLQIVWDTVKQAIIDAFNGAVEKVKSLFQDLLNSAKSYLQPIIDLLSSIINLGSSADAASAGGGNGFARGGYVRGSGTSTSDSIAAWLSNNEFVMRAKAVRKYGTSFMNAINRGELDPSRILGFAAGGLVQSFTAPKVSLAGVSASGPSGRVAPKILNLSIEGQDFEGLLVPENVADRLEKYAINHNTASAGRKPGWVGGRR